MKRKCPNIHCCKPYQVIKSGHYKRKSDSKLIQRFRCLHCKTHFSSATFSKNYGQNRRRLNPLIYKMLVSGMSQRRIAKTLKCNLKTVARKFLFLSEQMREENLSYNSKLQNIRQIQIDEMETWVHSKLKPLSIFVVVEKHSRRILEARVSQMPAKGLIRDKSLRKYGKIQDERREDILKALDELSPVTKGLELIESDENPRYPSLVRRYYGCSYKRYKGRRGCVTGQGELKAGGFDPLFSLNHTCAMLRANINRLFRRSWCTSKIKANLQRHINLYIHYHNHHLLT